jgi:putative ABC transport system substrate-binding protein
MQRRLCLLAAAQMVWVPGTDALAQSRTESSGDASVLLVSSDTSSAYVEAATSLTLSLAQSGVAVARIRQLQVAEFKAISALPAGIAPVQIVVTLGAEAAMALAAHNGAAPVLCALIPRGSFQRVLQLSGRRVSSRFTALYLDQPLERQFELVHLALPKVQRLGVLLGSESVNRLPALKALASDHGFSLASAQVDSASGVFSALATVLGASDVLLALADPAVFNNNSIQNILLSAFRARVPMVGFSPAYARAGALMSLHTTPVQVGVQTAMLVRDALAGLPLPSTPAEPDDFEIIVNSHVARVLDLDLQPQKLRQALKSGKHRS